MNKKITALLISAFTLGALSSHAQSAATVPAPAAPSVSVTLTPAFVSQYMFRGQRLGGLSFQPVIEATYGNLGLGLWNNFPVNDEVPGVSDPEIDPYGYYTFNVNESFSVVPGFTFYTYPNADEGAGFYRHSFEPSLAINYTIGGVKLTPKIYYDLNLEGPTFELSAFYAVPMPDLGSELDFSATYGEYLQKDVVKNSIPATKAWGKYWSVGVSIPYQVTKNSKITLGFAWVKGEDSFVKQGTSPKSVNSLAVGRGVGSISYAITF
jgi:hypothetical protein